MFKLSKFPVVFAIGLFSVQGVAADQFKFTVVNPNSSQYPLGHQFTENDYIRLKKNEKLTLKTVHKGKKYQYTVLGPYSEDKSKDDDDSGEGGLIEIIKELVKPRRGGGIEAQMRKRLKEPWLLVVSQDDNFCYRTGTPIQLWRADSSRDVNLTITEEENWESESRFWPANQDIFPLSIDTQSSSYLVSIGKIHSTTLHPIPDGLSYMEQAVWASQKGCERQTRLLLKETVTILR